MRAFLTKQRLLVVTAVIGALGAGVALGFLLGVPGLSSAEPAPAATGGPRVGARLAIPSLGVAAKTIGVSTTVLAQDLRSGQSIAQVAQSKNVPVQSVIDALTKDATTRIDKAVQRGRLTSAQASTLKSNLTSKITAFVNQAGPPGRFGVTSTLVPGARPNLPRQKPVTGTAIPHVKGRFPTSTAVPFARPFAGLGPQAFAAAAKVIGVSPTALVQDVRNGQSIAEVAQGRNVSPQTVISALTADATNRIDAAVKAGKLTSTQAASLKANLTNEVTTYVNQKGMAGGFPGPLGPFGGKGRGPGPGAGPPRPPASSCSDFGAASQLRHSPSTARDAILTA